MPIYFPQFANAMIAQPGFSPQIVTKTSIQDCLNGHRTAFGWYGTGLAGYPTQPLNRWSVPYRGLSETERATLEGFFASMHGSFGSFTFLDPAGNLCAFSEDFTNSVWSMGGISVTTNGGVSDPYGGSNASVLTSSAANGLIDTFVLPDGDASGYSLCGSVWAKAAAAGQQLLIGFVDAAFTLITSQVWNLPAGTWQRITCPITLASSTTVRLLIGGNGTWSTGQSISLFGAQCSPSLGPGEYAKSPGAYGLHSSVRFDQDELEITKSTYNQNDCTLKLVEFFAP